uniref:RdRp catalytic domain-containing protein n=1 Tax=Trichuris muris TaxID=70415 RepID=A0A5S6QU87_TRIMR
MLYLFHHDSKKEGEELILMLMQTRAFSPRFLNEIYWNSPSGARIGIVASVSHVRTIRNLAQRSHQGIDKTEQRRLITRVRNPSGNEMFQLDIGSLIGRLRRYNYRYTSSMLIQKKPSHSARKSIVCVLRLTGRDLLKP